MCLTLQAGPGEETARQGFTYACLADRGWAVSSYLLKGPKGEKTLLDESGEAVILWIWIVQGSQKGLMHTAWNIANYSSQAFSPGAVIWRRPSPC